MKHNEFHKSKTEQKEGRHINKTLWVLLLHLKADKMNSNIRSKNSVSSWDKVIFGKH